MRILVTGIAGFVGQHLVRYLEGQGVELWGLLHRGHPSAESSLPPAAILREGDLLEATSCQQVLAEARPDGIVHLAGLTQVGASWEDPVETFRSNVIGTINLFQGIIATNLSPRVLIIGSNEEYGSCSTAELPIRESHPLRPINPYGVSKVAQDLLGYQYWVSHRLPCIRVRPFNHIGPGQSEAFALSSFARQIAEAEAGLRKPVVRVGNLEAQRDFTDVRDIVRAYALALEYGEPGAVYNIGSGQMHRLQDLLERLVELSRVSITIDVDAARLRPADIPATLCDATLFRRITGWKPEIPLEQTLQDMLEYWRSRVPLARVPGH